MKSKRKQEDYLREMRKKNKNKFLENFNLKYPNNEYTLLNIDEEYVNAHSRISVQCNKCGDIAKKLAHSVLKSDCKCKQGEKIRKYFFQNDYFKKIEKLYPKQYTFLESYQGAHVNVLVRHNICGYEWKVKPVQLTSKKAVERYSKGVPKCPNCNNRHILNHDDFVERVYKLVDDEYSVLSNYVNGKDKVLMKHNKCGYEWDISPCHFSGGCRCPNCASSKVSGEETQLFDYIKQILPEHDIKRNVRIIGNLELDIYIPELNIAFEYCGIYWHSTHRGKDSKYHINKTMEHYKLGIRVVQIFSDEWKKSPMLVKSKIKSILGANTNEKIYARKCICREVSKIDKKMFLENNHIQGNDNSSFYEGLYYDDKLIAIMTFANPRINMSRGNETGVELTRFATDINYAIPGAFGKLLKHCINKYEMTNIYSYADIRWSSLDKNVYITNNFVREHISRPNYWYFHQSTERRLYRYQFRKSMLKNKFPDIYDDSLTEKEIMHKANYYCIYDCGTIKYRLNIN